MAEKKVKGRKRHIAVDTLGCLLDIRVHAANTHDTKAGGRVAVGAFDKYPTILAFSGDEGYRGSFVEYIKSEFEGTLGVNISERIKPTFEVLPKRWIVERTFAWMGNSRRLTKDFEITVNSAENMAFISNLHTLLKRF